LFYHTKESVFYQAVSWFWNFKDKKIAQMLRKKAML
jgi:hypothetical protein